jgi:radical SAM protein with 4Fe4S-binding SPASM domain
MLCPEVPIITSGQFGQRLLERLGAERHPLLGGIELTFRCNLACVHCYVNRPAGDREARAGEMTTAGIHRIIDEITEAGCLHLQITGGEPLLRPDFLEIQDHAVRNGLLVTLYTNGTLLTPEIADHFAALPPNAVEITLYGRTPGTFERVTRRPGSFDRCMRAVDLLLERGIRLALKTMVLRANRHELAAMKAFAEERGCPFRYDVTVNSRLDGAPGPADCRISEEEAIELELADARRVEGWRKFWREQAGPPNRPEYLYQCGAGRRSFHIDPAGRLTACIMVREPAYDLRRGTFREAWDEFMPAVLERKWDLDVPCRTCRLYALCGQCPGIAHLETGDARRPVPYLCRLAHRRAEAFGLLDEEPKPAS